MRRAFLFGSILLFGVPVCGTAGAQSPSPAPPASPTATAAPSLQALLDERTAAYVGSGLILAKIGPGGVTVTQSGSSGTDRPIDRHSLFEIGSVTKTFTATILASMVLDGSVKLDDPIARYLPKNVRVPQRNGKQITLLDLATQHSGLPRLPSNLTDVGAADPYARYTLADMYAFLSSYKLTRDPGAEYEYSNYGIGLLGQVLAARAHTTYAKLLQARVLDPLGMRDTTLAITPGQKPRFTGARNADGDAVAPWTFDSIAPAGALHSSIDDMLAFARCNMGNGPLARTCLFAQKPRADIPGNRIGLVWWTGDTRHIVHHGGDTAGYHAAVAISADRSEAAIALADGGTGVEDVALHALDAGIPVGEPPASAALDESTLDAYAGSYVAKNEGIAFTVTHNGPKLYVQLSGQQALRIFSDAPDHFVAHEVAASFEFVRDDGGKPVALVLFQNGQLVTFLRPGAASPPAAALSMFPPAVDLDRTALGAYVGNYRSTIGTFFVTLVGDQVFVRLSGQTAIPVFASAKDAFFYKVVDARIVFQRSDAGAVTSLTLYQNGAAFAAMRMP